jgi:hypothetical protein
MFVKKERVVFEKRRKVWRPTRTSSTLVISVPDTSFLEEGDYVTVKVTSRLRLIVEKA